MTIIWIIALAFFVFFDFTIAQSQSTVAVQLCPLYLAIQNRCPTTTSTTFRTTTTRRPTPAGNGTDSSESDVTDSCGLPMITFCPAMQLFLSGGSRCNEGETVEVRLKTLGELLVSPSQQNAASAVGARNVDALGDSLTSVSKSIQATPTQATIGVTFIPVGQLIGGK